MILEAPEIPNVRSHLEGRIVLANGCFDIFHIGHLRHLREARKLGEWLFVSLTANEHVNKGPTRPVFDEKHRAEILDALKFVDFVYYNREPSPGLGQFDLVKPHIYVKGGDYTSLIPPDLALQKHKVESLGGKFVIIGDKLSGSTELTRFLDRGDVYGQIAH